MGAKIVLAQDRNKGPARDDTFLEKGGPKGEREKDGEPRKGGLIFQRGPVWRRGPGVNHRAPPGATDPFPVRGSGFGNTR